MCAELTAATGARLKKAGLTTRMSGPDCVTPKQADAYMKAMEETPGALANFAQITYHLYWDPENVEARNVIRRWGEKLKVPVAQTEWMGASDMPLVRHLYLCLTEANAVAWDRYVRDLKVDAKAGTLDRQPTAWYLRQYFRFVRPGSVRVKMDSPDASVKPVAFLSPAKKPVMVFLNEDPAARPVRIEGLPALTYRVSYSAAGRFAVALPEITVAAGGPLELTLPAQSVLTITADPPTPGPEFSTKVKN
jgi:O-glycosyl hydrolase